MEAVIDKIKEAIVPLSSAFYSGETLGANIFVSWPMLMPFSMLFLVPRVYKVTVCTKVH